MLHLFSKLSMSFYNLGKTTPYHSPPPPPPPPKKKGEIFINLKCWCLYSFLREPLASRPCIPESLWLYISSCIYIYYVKESRETVKESLLCKDLRTTLCSPRPQSCTISEIDPDIIWQRSGWLYDRSQTAMCIWMSSLSRGPKFANVFTSISGLVVDQGTTC